MARKLKSDPILFTATILLVALGVVMVYSASVMRATEEYQQPYQFLTKQAMWGLLGVALLWVVMNVNYRVYREPAFIWSGLAVVSVALIAVLFMPEVNGARRWFAVGGFGIQPSELAKLVAIIFTAALLERRMHRINDLKYSMAPIAIVLGALLTLIVIEPDFGTAASIAVISGVMVFAAGLSWLYIAGSVALLVPVAVVLVAINPERVARVFAFLHPERDPLGAGYQPLQSMIAVGTGGISGRGFMNGVQKLFYLPEAHTDFIYAVISEELGLIGATAVLICFALIAWRGLRVSLFAEDAFGSFLALGVTMMIAAQAFVNISVVLSLLPTKGISLPFVSYGGSSFLVSMVGMGMLLNVSQHTSSR